MVDKEPGFNKSALDGLDEEIAAARRGETTERFDAKSALENLDYEVAAARRGIGDAPTASSVLVGLEQEVARARQERGLPPANPPRRTS